MADFKIAMKATRPWEGGYVKDPKDKGGETYAGITRRDNPHWAGWVHVDAAKPLKRGAMVPAAEPFVYPLYEKKYWPKVMGDQIADQRVAGFLFDWYVNSGYHAIIAAQRIIGQADDGVMGPKTLAGINSYNPEALFMALKSARETFVRGIVRRVPDQAKFLHGWLNRINSFR